ncbi:MAG: UDP-N-acetylmuramoyl-tripeptide--D-alanyl-D-alanine ligase [Eubacterium sp.]|nr:UDP-N-acetylmuramoyl-tripeptide--D-alanyl-D-alanine ligase [Eubacterium sp.]
MKNMTLSNVAAACGGTYIGPEESKNIEIKGAVIDSRQVEKGFLFIPIKGEKVDGHKFIPNVFEQGAAAVLSEMELENPAGPYILVESTPIALKAIAEFYREQLDIKFVGIAGSVGKTSTKEMVATVLEQKYNVLKTAGNFNNEVGLPLTILRIRDEHEVAVVEMGISDFGEMHRLAKIAKPDICVMTNIGMAHLENLKSRDGILKAKSEMFDYLKEDGIIVLNGNDDKLSTVGAIPVWNDVEKTVTPIRYMVADEEGNFPSDTFEKVDNYDETVMVRGINVENRGLEGMAVTLQFPEEERQALVPIPGIHNVYNACAGACVGRKLGLTNDEIIAGIESAKTIDGRTNLIKANDMIIIDDCYNANPVSMKAAIDVLTMGNGRKIAVLGDMGELGENEHQLHAEVGMYVAEKGIDVLFCAGALSADMANAAQEMNMIKMAEGTAAYMQIYYFTDKEALMNALLPFVKAGDTVLVKASHFMGYPEIVNALGLSKEKYKQIVNGQKVIERMFGKK